MLAISVEQKIWHYVQLPFLSTSLHAEVFRSDLFSTNIVVVTLLMALVYGSNLADAPPNLVVQDLSTNNLSRRHSGKDHQSFEAVYPNKLRAPLYLSLTLQRLEAT